MSEDEIEKTISAFGGLVKRYTVSTTPFGETKQHIDIRIFFQDGSKMKAFFVVLKMKLENGYSFHWMREDNSLIIRWDNTPHNHKVATMPYHKHVGADENVQPSEPMTLRKVLAYIAGKIGFLSVLAANGFHFYCF